MPKSSPYQPLIFRLLHTFHGILILCSAMTGFWLYNTWDARWGRLPFPKAENEWLNYHHQIGEVLTGVFLIFLIYSLAAGRRRLTQPATLFKLGAMKPKQRWFSLHRLTNVGLLVMVFLAMLSSRLMGGAKTITQGEWGDIWYNIHLLSWALLVVLTLLHLLLTVKVGGMPFTMSAIALKVTPKDSPLQWPKRFSSWVRQFF